MRHLFTSLIALLMLTMTAGTLAAEPPVHGLFGYNAALEPFKDKTPGQVAEVLAGWGVNAVWNVGDPALIDALHAKGIKVYATVAFFYGWGETGRPIKADGAPLELYAENHWYQGTCPTDPGFIERGLAGVAAAADTKVDGVWVDAVAYPIFWEAPEPRLDNTCFCDRCVPLFEKQSGVDVPDDKADAAARAAWILENHADAWTAWKIAHITDLMRQCNETLKAKRPDAVLGMFTVPWTPDERGGAIRTIVGQDFAELAKHVDVFSPMAYHRMCGLGEDTTWIQKVSASLAAQTGKPVWPIVQAHSEPDCAWNQYTMTAGEFANALRDGLASPSGGVIVFTTDAMIGANFTDTAKAAFGGK